MGARGRWARHTRAGVRGQASESLLVQSSCASHTGAYSSYWWLYAAVHISTEEETTSDRVQMWSACTVLLSLSSCSSSRPAGARSDLHHLLRESTTVDALRIYTSPLVVSSSADMYTTIYSHQ